VEKPGVEHQNVSGVPNGMDNLAVGGKVISIRPFIFSTENP
jgi:hypothetical protein